MIRVSKTYGSSTIMAEGATNKECFTRLADAVDVLGVSKCGMCGSKAVFPIVRQAKSKAGHEFDSYEWRCGNKDCQAVLQLGTHQTGDSLFRRPYIDGPDGRDYSTAGWRQIPRKEVEANVEQPNS